MIRFLRNRNQYFSSKAFLNSIKLLQGSLQYLTQLQSSQLQSFCLSFYNHKAITNSPHSNLLNKDRIQMIQYHMNFLKQFLSKGKVGFLRGDINPSVIYLLKQYLSTKQYSEVSSQFYKQLMNQLSEKQYFRLPKLGIKDPNEQCVQNLFQRQVVLQDQSFINSLQERINTMQSLQRMNKLFQVRGSNQYIAKWYPKIVRLIAEQKSLCMKQKGKKKLSGDRKYYAGLLSQLSIDKASAITLSVMMKYIVNSVFIAQQDIQSSITQIGIGEINMNGLIKQLAFEISLQIIFEKQEKLLKKKYIQQARLSKTQVKVQKLKYELKNLKKNLKTLYSHQKNDIQWQNKIKLSSLLVYMAKQVMRLPDLQIHKPILQLQYKRSKFKGTFIKRPFFIVHQNFVALLKQQIFNQQSDLIQLDRALPMVSLPAAWSHSRIGGYYQRSTLVMRFSKGNDQQKSLIHNNQQRIFKVLDYLGCVPWKLNTKIMDVIKQIWNQGQQLCQIPKRFSQSGLAEQAQTIKQMQIKNKLELNKKLQNIRDQHSLRCSFLLRLQIAQSMKNVNRIYFPHNMDFRGRVYPIPPHMNHMGSDISRGLMLFTKGIRLGKQGLKWLKIQFSNVSGKDKATLEERVKFAQQNLDLIKATAQNPLKYRQWTKNQDAWQSLSAIFQIAQAYKLQNPQDYVSHLHVHQDGSCNGLQHYAALGRDRQGGKQVNLIPGEKPGDIYTHVANLVSQKIEKILQDTNNNQFQLASKIKGNIKRKTIKQTVMTSVYGVTFIGARDQIHKQIKEQEFLQFNQQYKASVFVAKLTMQSIRDLFDRAHLIKQWLISCAGISNRYGMPMSWITPLGLPVVQPYRNQAQYQSIQTISGKILVQKNYQKLPINKNKQKSAFPPNYVHSLDSTHMMLTCQECIKEGITFAAVHDSYWTHAACVPTMNRMLREKFVQMHSMPLLQQLRLSMTERFPEQLIQQVPQKGSLDLNEVLKSQYFFA